MFLKNIQNTVEKYEGTMTKGPGLGLGARALLVAARIYVDLVRGRRLRRRSCTISNGVSVVAKRLKVPTFWDYMSLYQNLPDAPWTDVPPPTDEPNEDAAVTESPHAETPASTCTRVLRSPRPARGGRTRTPTRM